MSQELDHPTQPHDPDHVHVATRPAAVERGRVDILGVGIDPVGLDEAIGRIEDALRRGVRLLVVTANPELVVLARRDPAVRRVAETADLVVPDGIGLVLAARILGRRLPGRARGRDIVLRIAHAVVHLKMSMYLLGAREGVAARAADELRRRFPRLQVAGTQAGSPSPSEERAIVARVNVALPDVLLVAYGMPQQELWLQRNLPALQRQVKVAVGVGGAFDYLSGEAALPPEWMARIGLEWLWRLAREPWRWRRQLALPLFLLLVLRERLGPSQP